MFRPQAPRSLPKRRAYLVRKQNFLNSRDPAFSNPELERGWNDRAGVEGSLYSHRVHAYKRYFDGGLAGASTRTGIATSASEGEHPFAASSADAAARPPTRQPAGWEHSQATHRTAFRFPPSAQAASGHPAGPGGLSAAGAVGELSAPPAGMQRQASAGLAQAPAQSAPSRGAFPR